MTNKMIKLDIIGRQFTLAPCRQLNVFNLARFDIIGQVECTLGPIRLDGFIGLFKLI